jgi:hypothetical protein
MRFPCGGPTRRDLPLFDAPNTQKPFYHPKAVLHRNGKRASSAEARRSRAEA